MPLPYRDAAPSVKVPVTMPLGEFLPESAIGDGAQSVDAEVDELAKGIHLLGNLPPRSDLSALNRKYPAG
jgi:hypothetical protein